MVTLGDDRGAYSERVAKAAAVGCPTKPEAARTPDPTNSRDTSGIASSCLRQSPQIYPRSASAHRGIRNEGSYPFSRRWPFAYLRHGGFLL